MTITGFSYFQYVIKKIVKSDFDSIKFNTHSITEPPCLNYYNQTGTCVPITSCQSLLNLESHPNRTYDDLLILDGSYCGPESGLKWVCCVSGIITTEKPLEVPTERPTPVHSTTQRNFGPFKIVTPIPSKSKRAIDVIGKSIRLLPDPDNNECGLHFPDRIIGGNKTALDEHPWMALLLYVLRKFYGMLYLYITAYKSLKSF